MRPYRFRPSLNLHRAPRAALVGRFGSVWPRPKGGGGLWSLRSRRPGPHGRVLTCSPLLATPQGAARLWRGLHPPKRGRHLHAERALRFSPICTRATAGRHATAGACASRPTSCPVRPRPVSRLSVLRRPVPRSGGDGRFLYPRPKTTALRACAASPCPTDCSTPPGNRAPQAAQDCPATSSQTAAG